MLELAGCGEAVDERETRLGTLGHRHRDGAVELDDRGRLEGGQLPVEHRDLPPVGGGRVGRARVQRGDRGLEQERAGLAHAQPPHEDRAALGDLLAVPERAVLLLERHEVALRAGTGGAAGVVEQHEREQAEDLGFIGHQLGEQTAEADRLAAEVPPHEGVACGGGVALVEDEVDDLQHRREALGQQVIRGHAVGDVGVADLALRPHEPLRHRRLRDEEGAGDLGRLEAGDGAQRERDLSLRRERRVAAGEDQPQPVVLQGALRSLSPVRGRLLRRLLDLEEALQQLALAAPRLIAAEAVDRLAPSGRDQPGGGAARDAVPGPALEGDGQRLLERILGELEVAAAGPDQRGEDARRVVAEDPLDGVARLLADGRRRDLAHRRSG